MYNKSTTEIVRETVEMAKDLQGMVDNFRAAEEAGTRKALAVSAGRKLAREETGGSVAGDQEGESVLGSSVVGEGEELGSVKGRRGRKKKGVGATPVPVPATPVAKTEPSPAAGSST